MDSVEDTPEAENSAASTGKGEQIATAPVNNDLEDGYNSVSQKDYVPTPYRQSAWEGIEKYDFNASFLGLSLDVVASEEFRHDPMFEVFQDVLDAPIFEQYRSEKKAEEESVCEVPEELLEAARAEAYQQGLAKGREDAEAEYAKKLSELEAQYAQKKSELQTQILEAINEKVSNIEKRALELSLAVSRKVLEKTVEARPDYVFEIIQKALYSIPGAKAATIRLSPEDYEFISIEGLPSSIAELPMEVTYEPDESIVAGCIVDSELGTINLEIDSMWNEISQNLFKMVND
jgi:flagellar assembly protein FliH